MQNEDMVPAGEFCVHHNVELSFIHSLRDYGMIQAVLLEEETFLPILEIGQLERIVRLRFELDINLEGIDTITHMLGRMEAMQHEIVRLTNRLKAYEG